MAGSTPNGTAAKPAQPLEVAVVGGGIIGVMTALGLHRRGFKTTTYERAQTWPEVSAGFAFTGAARVWMEKIEPALVELLGRISQKTDASTSNAYWNGYHPRTRDEFLDESTSLMFRTPTNNLSFWGCVRSQFLKGMADMLPAGSTRFGKQLLSYEDDLTKDKVVLRFDDGTTAECDVLLGCDGIHSVTRKILLGAEHPASRAGFSHTVTYRTIVPIDVGVKALGEKVAHSACNHLGPDACLMVYPVMSGTLLNVAVYAYEEPEFPDPDRMTVKADRTEIKKLLEGWAPPVADIWKLYPQEVVKWGIFDLEANPPPAYSGKRVCLVGDAAHASTPYLGVGACTGVEDALVICTLLESVQNKALGGEALKTEIQGALQTYNKARLHRGRWIHHHSRQMGQMYHWRYGPTGRDHQRMKKKLEDNWSAVVGYDIFKDLPSHYRELAGNPQVAGGA